LLDDATLEEASMFLVGRCGCRIKNENPGWDLLLNVDWEKALLLAGQARAATAESNQSAVFVPKAPEVVAIIPEAATQDTGDQGTSLWVALGAVIFTMLLLWGLKSRRV
jgi:LPXTG-motif cell wall-anchored protein